MELAIAAVIFFGIPLAFIGWTAWLIFGGMARYDELEHPMGDATETPRTIVNIRRANHKAKQ